MTKKIEISDPRSAHLVEAFEAMTEPAKQMTLKVVEGVAAENLRPAEGARTVAMLRMHGAYGAIKARVSRTSKARYTVKWDTVANAVFQLSLPGITPVL